MSAEVLTVESDVGTVVVKKDKEISPSKESKKQENGTSDHHSDSDEINTSVEDSFNDSKDDTATSEKSLDNSKMSDSTSERGKRERKKVERYVQEVKKEEVEAEGWGTPLGEIPFIRAMILKFNPDELKGVHRISYGRPGTSQEVRKNLYKFKGFPFTRNDSLFEKKKASLEKFKTAELKKILLLFGLERGGLKGDLVDRVLEFMLDPHDKGKATPTSKRKKSKGSKKSKKVAAKGKVKKTKQSKAKKEEIEDKEESDDDDDDDEEEEEEEELPSPPPKKKKQQQQQRKKPAPESAKKKRARTPSSSSDLSDSDADVPLKKIFKKEPSDSEIAAFIEKLLNSADLEEVTMKKLCQQVYEHYPDHDLAHKKDFIKTTVKKILS